MISHLAEDPHFLHSCLSCVRQVRVDKLAKRMYSQKIKEVINSIIKYQERERA
jgi:hypothetical protein